MRKFRGLDVYLHRPFGHKAKKMNVLYLHGLESKPTGPKMRYPKRIVLRVIMLPKLIMKIPEAFEILDLCIAEEFDMIIGSSMGGYFACA